MKDRRVSIINNYLTYFKFNGFETTEAVWDFSQKDVLSMFRLTRRGIGQFLNPDSADPQNIIDVILRRNPHIKTMTIPVTVTGMVGQKYTVETYGLDGIYQMAIESDLPKAKVFLRLFPALQLAMQRRVIKPPAIGSINSEILGYINLPYKDKRQYRLDVCNKLKWSGKKFYDKAKKAAVMLGFEIVQHRKPHSDKGSFKKPADHEKIKALYLSNPQLGNKEIWKMSGTTYSYGYTNAILRDFKKSMENP